MSKALLALLAVTFVAAQPAQSVNLTGYWQDDLGAKYSVRQVGDRVHWVGDGRPRFMNVFDGVIAGDAIRGDWVDVPGGQLNDNGELTLCIDTSNRLVKTFSSGYGGTILTRVGSPVSSGLGRCGNSTRPVPPPGRTETLGTGVPLPPPFPQPGRGAGTGSGPATPSGGSGGPGGSSGASGPVDGRTFQAQNLRYFGSPSYQACDAACQGDPNCRGWSWVKPGAFNPGDGPVCYLVSRIDAEVKSNCCVSGYKAGAAGRDTPPPGGLVNGCRADQPLSQDADGRWQWLTGAPGEQRVFLANGTFTSNTRVSGLWRRHHGNPDGSVAIQLAPTSGFTGQEPLVNLMKDRNTLRTEAGALVAQRDCR